MEFIESNKMVKSETDEIIKSGSLVEKYDQKDKGDELFKWILENVIPSTKKGLLKWKCSQKRKLIQNATRGDKSMFSFIKDNSNPEKQYMVPNQQSQNELIESFPKQYQPEIKTLLLCKIMSKSKQ